MNSMKHLLRLVGALALTTGTAASVVACGPATTGVDLAHDLTVKELKVVNISADKPAADEIKFSLQTVNPKLNIKGVDIKDIKEVEGKKDGWQATVTPDGKIYKKGDGIVVTFTVKVKEDLGTILSQDKRDLGNIAEGTEKVVKEALKAKIKGFDENSVTIKIENNVKATVTATPDGIYKGNPVEVTFKVQTSLDTVISKDKRDLGYLDKADDATVTNALTTKIKELNIDAVKISVDKENNNATVTAKPGGIYKGNPVTVNFKVKAQLADVIKETKLGNIADSKTETILTALKSKNGNNPELNNTNLTVKVNADQNGATIDLTKDSIFQGKAVDVTFNVQTSLDTIITPENSNLGYLDKADAATVKEALKTKIEGFDTESVDVVVNNADEGYKATVTAKPEGKYTGSVEVVFNLHVSLDTIITPENSNLGNLDKDDEATVKVALAKIKELNTDAITVGKPEKDGEGYKATVTAVKDGMYTGSAEVTFTAIAKKDLNTIITPENSNLGELDKADAATVKEALKTKIEGFDTKSVDVVVNDTDKGYKATVSPIDNGIYKGEAVEVTFTVDIAKAITHSDLSKWMRAPSAEALLKELVKQNPSLDSKHIQIVNLHCDVKESLWTWEYSAHVVPKDGDTTYVGDAKITYKVGFHL